jgi:ornithine cyclodeaminase
MILFSTHTGLIEALLLDNGYLTDVRTAAAGAVAARHMAKPDARVAAILGAGVQARLQLEALTLVRPNTSPPLWARASAKSKAAARELSETLGISVVAAESAQAACSGADIIVTTTPAEQPILQASWLQPGQHVTAMGSDSEHKNEIEPAALERVKYVADSLMQTRRLGELHHAVDADLVMPDQAFPELGQIISGQAPGREHEDDITLCDLTGTGVQDTAIATLAHARAREAGAGRSINTKESSGGLS